MEMRACREDLAAKIEQNKTVIEDLKVNSEFFFNELKEVTAKVKTNEANIAQYEKRVQYLEEKLNEQERHQRRINLRLHNLPEEKEENVKKKIMDICHAVAPDIGEDPGLYIDICHRIGRKENSTRRRPIIIRFRTRSARDHVWKMAKQADILKARGLRFQEDLTAKDKLTRELLWPQIDEARKQQKTAYYVGAKGYIDGKEIRLT